MPDRITCKVILCILLISLLQRHKDKTRNLSSSKIPEISCWASMFRSHKIKLFIHILVIIILNILKSVHKWQISRIALYWISHLSEIDASRISYYAAILLFVTGKMNHQFVPDYEAFGHVVTRWKYRDSGLNVPCREIIQIINDNILYSGIIKN